MAGQPWLASFSILKKNERTLEGRKEREFDGLDVPT
jgi:hypothetical protein